MLGREHEADLEREALKWRRAAQVHERPRAYAVAPHDERLRKRVHAVLTKLAACAARAVGMEP
jgi:hypothetical protein